MPITGRSTHTVAQSWRFKKRHHHAEPTMVTAPFVEDLVHPHHVDSAAEAQLAATARWRDLWASWRATAAPDALVPFRDRTAYGLAVEARQSEIEL